MGRDQKPKKIFTGTRPETFPSRPSGSNDGKDIRPTINLSSINIEGIKTNIPFLIELSKVYQLICVQEHWLDDKNKVFNNLVPNYELYVRCWNCNEH